MDVDSYPHIEIGEDLYSQETDFSLVPLDNYVPQATESLRRSSINQNLISDDSDYWHRIRLPLGGSDGPAGRTYEDCVRLCGPKFAGHPNGEPAAEWAAVAKLTLRESSPGRTPSGRDLEHGRTTGPSSAASPSPSHYHMASSLPDRQSLNSSLDVEPVELLSRLKSAIASQSPAVIRVSDSRAPSISPRGPSRLREPTAIPLPGLPQEPTEVQINSIEQEGRILARIADLRKQGKWEDSRIPKCVVAEPFSRGIKNFTKEVTWVATLIAKEKKAKVAMAKKIAYAAKKWHERKAEKIRKLEREEEQRLRKTAKQIGSLVHAWWLELSKVAQLKQREEIEIRKKGIRDLHLRHLMDQTEEFSTRMAKGLAKSASQASLTVGESVNLEHIEDPTDEEYSQAEEDSFEDEEDTISDEEGKESAEDCQMDAKLLEDEANIPLEDLLPPEYRELLLAQSADEPPSKRKRTISRTLSADVYELEPMLKKTKDDDLSVLVNLPSDSGNASSSGSVMFDEKIKSHEAALEKLKPKGNSLSSTEVVTKVPFLLRGNLREYQHVGLDWLVSLYKNKMNGILADEMGLGKTIQTIAHIAHLASEEGDWGPHLIIVPTSVLLNWELEFKRWCPGLIIKTYYGSRKQRLELRTGWTKPDSFHICITSYKVATQDYTSFRRMKWHYLILDEAQAIKNYRSQRWMRIAEFPSQRRLLLTGTPMQNSLEEVWALLHFLAPELFESLNMFQQLFSNLTAMSEGRKPQDQAIVKQLHTVLRPFILRRLKSEVETQLPKKYEQVLKCRLSKRQRYLYDDYMSRSKTKETLKTGNYLSVINILMQLRKVCNHPNLFEERPVLSPLVVHPLTVTFPSLVFDVLYRDTSDAPYFREVSTTLKTPFSLAPSNLMSFESSRLEQLIPADDKLILTADQSKEIAVPRSLPTDFSSVFDVLEFSMVDLMAGTPFVMDDDRLCNSGCKHPPPPPIKAYSTVATVHMGRAKRSSRKKSERRNGLIVDTLTNGTKKARTSFLELDSGRITTKHLTEELLPFRFRLQREDHCEILVATNRQKCLMKPLVADNVLNLITLLGGEGVKPSFVSGYLQCRRAQEESPRNLPFQKDLTGLSGLTEMGSSVQKRIEQPGERYWVEHGSVALMPVLAPPPMLVVHNMPSSVTGRMNIVKETLMPVLREVSEILHPVERLRIMKFPETRLIQYDCGKLQKLDELLRDRFAGGHRCLIFTQMTRVLDILEIFLTYHGYKYLRLDGSTGIELRQTLMDRFNRDTRYFCFILSTRSGGVGVNLTGADTVIFYDSDWNPTMDAQAQDRCHRIGQTRDVNIYRLISEYTVEENIFQKASQKLMLGHLAIESGGFTTAVLKRENFKEIFGLKENEVLAEMPETANEATFESAIAKVEDADDVEAAKKAKTEAAVENEEEDDDDDDTPKFKAIQSYLTPIQCFGVKYLEEHVMNQEVMEELEQTREEVERRKKEWELSRLETAKAERAKAEEEASDPFLVSRSLMDPKVRAHSDTGLRPRSARRVAAGSLLWTPPNVVAPQHSQSSEQKSDSRPIRTSATAVRLTVKATTPAVLSPQMEATKSQRMRPVTTGGKKKRVEDPDFKIPLPVKPRSVQNGKSPLGKSPSVITTPRAGPSKLIKPVAGSSKLVNGAGLGSAIQLIKSTVSVAPPVVVPLGQVDSGELVASPFDSLSGIPPALPLSSVRMHTRSRGKVGNTAEN